MPVSVTVKVYHCVNGNRPFDGQNGFCAMETDRLMDRMGSVPILPVKWTITIGIMLNFDGDGDRHGDGDGRCKQALIRVLPYWQCCHFCTVSNVNKLEVVTSGINVNATS